MIFGEFKTVPRKKIQKEENIKKMQFDFINEDFNLMKEYELEV